MSKCICCEKEGAILCPECMEKKDLIIDKIECNLGLIATADLILFNDRIEVRAKDPKKNKAIPICDIKSAGVLFGNVLELKLYGNGYESFGMESREVTEKWVKNINDLMMLYPKKDEPESEVSNEKDELKEKAIDFTKETYSKGKEVAKDVANEFKEFDYKSLKTKSGWMSFLKNKKILFTCIAVIAIIFIVPKLFGGAKDHSNMAKNIAINQIQQQVFAKDESVYDIKIVAKDGKGRYIVTATTKPGAFETWWAVLVSIADDNNHYSAIANYHGDGITQEEWIERYKTQENYHWGERQNKAN